MPLKSDLRRRRRRNHEDEKMTHREIPVPVLERIVDG
jgi:hypothetical protein